MALSIGLGLYTGQRRPGAAGRFYADAVPLAVAAENAGFDAFWVSEHHGWHDGYLPSPLSLLAAVATATQRIHLGTAVVLAPLQHPQRLAEDVAVVDHLSGGRLIVGLGLGYLDEEYRLFDVDRSSRVARLEAAISMLRRGIGSPPPLRLGGPPIWLGGYAPLAIERAARLADGHLIGRAEPHIIDAATAGLAATDSKTFTRAAIVVCMLDDEGGHSAKARTAFAVQQLGYEAMQRGSDVYGGLIDDPAGAGELSAGEIDRYVQVAGGTDDVVAGLRDVAARLGDWHNRHLVVRIVFPEEALDHQLERIARFGAAVLPALRAD
jgi:alkanesulfonate monooxygenase SsuD/methylene tetrahydromethanopterin reductase-like flavin-dependent oxidoreductase (luciferase family)